MAADRHDHELGRRILGDTARRSEREGLLERVRMDVVQPADPDPDPGHGTIAGAPLHGIENVLAETELVHQGSTATIFTVTETSG